MKEGALDCAIDSIIKCRIIQHDQRVLAAHLELQLYHARNGVGCDVVPGFNRAREAQCIDAADNRRAKERAFAHQQIQSARRHACAVQDIDELPCRGRRKLRGLEHDGIAEGQRRRDFPSGDRNRKIPGRDYPDHTHGFAGDIDVHTRADRWKLLARQAHCLPGKELQDLTCTQNFTDPFGAGFTLFARQQLADLFASSEELGCRLG